MKNIIVKFHRKYSYSDPTGEYHLRMELGFVGSDIMGKVVMSCEMLPSTEEIVGPFNPMELPNFEKNLKIEESEGRIKDLVMEEEIIGVVVSTEMSPMEITMN